MMQPGRKYSAGTGYRYGFNGKENDREVNGEGNQYDYGFRVYDARLAKFLSVDPMVKNFPWWTPYQFAGNTPIQAIDLDGKEIYFYVWDQNQQGTTALQKVHKIDVIEQKSDIFLLTDLFGWQTTQKANLRDIGLEQTWILYDNSWRLVPNNRLNQSLEKIKKEEWDTFLTPEKYEETLQGIKGIGDKAALAVNIAMLADGLKNMYRALKKSGKILAKSERLQEFTKRLQKSKGASSQDEALKLINNTLDEVEDAYSGVKKAKGIPSRDDGRMYGILDEKYVKTLEDGTKVATTRGNKVILKKDGSFDIQTLDGKTIFSKPAAPKK